MTEIPEARSSTTDRERALQELVRHLGSGRLSPAEFELRSTAVSYAHTKADLAEVFVDLPAIAEPPAAERDNRIPRLLILAAVITTVAVVCAAATGHWWWLLLLATIPAGFVALRIR